MDFDIIFPLLIILVLGVFFLVVLPRKNKQLETSDLVAIDPALENAHALCEEAHEHVWEVNKAVLTDTNDRNYGISITTYYCPICERVR